jgi:hypothetical protein
LIERALVVDPHIERALEEAADHGGAQEGEQQTKPERQTHPVDQNDGDIAAGHGEGPVRQIDEIHQAERDGEPTRQDEQQHAVGNAVEQNGQHDRPITPHSRDNSAAGHTLTHRTVSGRLAAAVSA